mmetsp:Transcript_8597/g.18910  ORF Transcript_8597/g.18910 Transcript_8597/m.18910 type:complete len:128 (-) Transcript_8597:126-509(-)
MCKGLAITKTGIKVPFELRTGLSVKGRGHVIEFLDMELAFNPDFIPMIIPIHSSRPATLDLGNNFQIEHLSIDGKKKQFKLDARVTVTPGMKEKHRFAYRSVERKELTSAYKCDVGRWLTNIGKFSN